MTETGSDPVSNESTIGALLTGVFWNFQDQRLRVLWRLVGLVIILLVVNIAIGVAFSAAGFAPPAFVGQFQSNLTIIFSIWAAARLLDRRKFSDTGIAGNKTWWTDCTFGLLLGAVLMSAIFMVESGADWITVVETFRPEHPDQPFVVAMIGPVVFFVTVGIAEELAFRGYLLLNLAEGFRTRLISPKIAIISAWVFTSAIFGFAHALNPNATFVSSLNIALAGIFLGAGYVLSGSLAIPIGVHVSWNFFQGHVFGFPVSGTGFSTATIIAIEQRGPESWTGGAFGPEGGMLGLIAILVGLVLTVFWIRLRYGKSEIQTQLAKPPRPELSESNDQKELQQNEEN